MKRLAHAACVAVSAALLLAGCAGQTASITGTIQGADGGCLYVLVPHGTGTDRYWLRQLPSGYDTPDELGLHTPDGGLIKMGDSLTVSGTVSWDPLARQCDGGHALDATAIQ